MDFIAFKNTGVVARPLGAWSAMGLLVLIALGGCSSNPASEEKATSAGKTLSPGLESGRYVQTSAVDGRQWTWVFWKNHLFERFISPPSSDGAGQSQAQTTARTETDGKVSSTAERGRWWNAGDSNRVVVETGRSRKRPTILEPLGDGRLLVDEKHTGGRPGSDALVRTGKATPLKVSRPMQVCFTRRADAPIAYDPRVRRHFPVLTDAAYPALEQAYLDSGLHPPAHLPVAIRGRWVLKKTTEGQGKKLYLKAAAFNNTIPGKTSSCPVASLTETFWALESLGDQAITPGQGQREISLRLMQGGRAVGLAGCNRFSGTWKRRADNLSFGKLATTRMMCPDRADTEQRYLKMLGNVKRFAIEGETLYLMDGAGQDLAKFGARYFN